MESSLKNKSLNSCCTECRDDFNCTCWEYDCINEACVLYQSLNYTKYIGLTNSIDHISTPKNGSIAGFLTKI